MIRVASPMLAMIAGRENLSDNLPEELRSFLVISLSGEPPRRDALVKIDLRPVAVRRHTQRRLAKIRNAEWRSLIDTPRFADEQGLEGLPPCSDSTAGSSGCSFRRHSLPRGSESTGSLHSTTRPVPPWIGSQSIQYKQTDSSVDRAAATPVTSR